MPTGQTRAGAARVRLPWVEGAPLAGWGPFLRFGSRSAEREDEARPLHVRALVLEGPDGARVALLAVELHGGSRYLTEKAASLLADLGFHVGNVFLAGTHNHAGPAGLYASPYYDAFAASTGLFNVGMLRVGFNQTLADECAARIEKAVREAVKALRPARIGTEHSLRLQGWSRNRSLPPLRANFPGEREEQILERFQEIGGGAGTTSLQRWAVDARVPSVAAFDALDGRLIGAYATRASHCALISRSHAVQSGDYFGHAVLRAERHHPGAVVALAAGAIGDADPLPPGMRFSELVRRREDEPTNFDDVARVGDALGEVLIESIARASRHTAPLSSLSTRFLDDVIAGAQVDDVTLASRADIGIPTLAGSELGRGDIEVVVGFHWNEGVRSQLPSGDAQWPKTTSDADDTRADWWSRFKGELGAKVSFSTTRPFLDVQHTRPPVRLVELRREGHAPVSLLGLPGEPTTWLAQTLGKLTASSAHAMVVGVTGDYSGYLTTEAEYERQHYEGSSTLWGRYTARWLARQVRRLVAGEGAAPPPAGTPEFRVLRESWVTRIDGDRGVMTPF